MDLFSYPEIMASQLEFNGSPAKTAYDWESEKRRHTKTFFSDDGTMTFFWWVEFQESRGVAIRYEIQTDN